MIREAAGSIVMGYKAIATGSCVRYKVSNPGEKNVLESVMCCMKSVMDSVFPVVEDVHGFMCEIFFPVTNDSVYGYTTDQVTYHDEPDLIRRCAISGLMVDRNDSGDALQRRNVSP